MIKVLWVEESFQPSSSPPPLQLVPGGMNNPTQTDCRVVVNGAAETQDGMLTPSLPLLRTAIDASLEVLSKSLDSINTEKLNVQETLSKLNEAIRAKQDDISIMEDKLQGLNQRYSDSQEVRGWGRGVV